MGPPARQIVKLHTNLTMIKTISMPPPSDIGYLQYTKKNPDMIVLKNTGNDCGPVDLYPVFSQKYSLRYRQNLNVYRQFSIVTKTLFFTLNNKVWI